MDIRRLEIFCEVVKKRGFSKAAASLRLTQSAVSQQIQSLERELGMPLFDEDDRATMTSAGQYLFGEASLVLAHLSDMKNGINSAAGMKGGAVRFGMIDVAATGLLPRVLKKFKSKFPGVALEAEVRATGELIAMVEGCELDFAIAVSNAIPDSMVSEDFYRDSIVAVVPAADKSLRGAIGVRDLKGEPLILYPSSSHSRALIEDVFRAGGVVPTVSMDMHYPAAICSLVRQGMGIGLISEISARENLLKGQRIVRIKELERARRIGVVRMKRRALSPQAKILVSMLRDTYAGKGR
jgi:DNA-binding transcriptional LysR family regulator